MQWHPFWDSLQGFLVIFSLWKRLGSQILPCFLQNPPWICACSNGYYNAGAILVPCSHEGFGDTKWMHNNTMCPHAMCEGRKQLSVWAAMKAILDRRFLHCSLFSQLSFLPEDERCAGRGKFLAPDKRGFQTHLCGYLHSIISRPGPPHSDPQHFGGCQVW